MLIVLSPAKTLDFDSPLRVNKFTQPEFLDRAEVIVERARKLTAPKLKALMGISDDLARENVKRFRDWHRPFTPDNARQAAFAFRGDVYQGLDAPTLKAADLAWAQKHVRILSGLYGLLRPLDLIQPYRLEMGLQFAVARRKNLYALWGSSIAESLNAAMRSTRSSVLVNLASNEYFKAVDTKVLEARVVSPGFKEKRRGTLKMISFTAKRARGLMTRYIIENRIDSVDGLQSFRLERYRYAKRESTDDQPLFTRPGRAAAK